MALQSSVTRDGYQRLKLKFAETEADEMKHDRITQSLSFAITTEESTTWIPTAPNVVAPTPCSFSRTAIKFEMIKLLLLMMLTDDCDKMLRPNESTAPWTFKKDLVMANVLPSEKLSDTL